jgi:hypothetical protein
MKDCNRGCVSKEGCKKKKREEERGKREKEKKKAENGDARMGCKSGGKDWCDEVDQERDGGRTLKMIK